MKPAPFSYYRATSVEDAITALSGADGMVAVLAGGQSLVPMLNLRLSPVDHLIDLRPITALSRQEETPEAICYGALTTHAAFEDGAVPDGTNGLMRYAASHIAYRAVRNRGTLGGALALADPAADWLTTAVALDASVTLTGPDGQRYLAITEFVVGPYYTQIAEHEIIDSVVVPRRSATERWGYYKVAPKVGEYAKSLAVALVDSEKASARLVIGAWSDVPLALEASASALLDGAKQNDLSMIVQNELDLKMPSLSPAERRLHTATAVRAAEQTRS
ncbi:MAG: FAD binding domain-containing protein [Gammaproteobacteria bacterium]|nr:FAD binding domain-containing protein [Gammaproteobacteria bacterium]